MAEAASPAIAWPAHLPACPAMKPLSLLAGALLCYLLLTGHLSLYRVFVFLVIVFLVFVYSLWRFQSSLLYQPRIFPQHATPAQNPPGFRSPSEHGLSYEEIFLFTPDNIRLEVWFVRPSALADRLARPTILFFPANAGNIGFRLDNIKQMVEGFGANVAILSYRGYGNSTGEPSEAGLLMDAETLWKFFQTRQDIDHRRIFLFGRSLGGSVAIALASSHNEEICGTILENTFTSISDMVDNLFPALKILKKPILRLKWPAIERISSISHPLLFLSGSLDEIVPEAQMKKLFTAAVESRQKTFHSVPTGLHNNTWLEGGEEYQRKFQQFLIESRPVARQLNNQQENEKIIENLKVQTKEFEQQKSYNGEAGASGIHGSSPETFSSSSSLPSPDFGGLAALTGKNGKIKEKREKQ